MFDTAISGVDRGARVILISALAGAAVSLYNYVTPLSGIDGTPGALLVIVATLIIFTLGIVLGTSRATGAWQTMVLIICLAGIFGTAFASYLLESHVLLVMMLACLLGWFVHYIDRSKSLT